MGLARNLRWWAADYVYAAVWQVRGAFDRTDPASFHGGDRTPIVVVPGIWESWRFMQPLITSMHDRGHPVHVIQPLRFNNRPVIDAAAQVDAYIEQHALDDAVLVGHSKGGLIGKYVMIHGASAPRIHAMLAVATPFRGSLYARFMPVPSLRVFSPKNAVILALALERMADSRIVSVFGQFDPHIPAGSSLPGAKNVELDTGGHFRILAHPRVLAELDLIAR
jgi:pimeloyl-ACP methyl ester carboxylesterase